jgi:Na+/proline symporter
MTASQALFVDIIHYRQGSTLVELDAKDTDKKLLMQARAFTIFIPLLVIALALVFAHFSDVYALIYFSFSFMFALLPPLFAGLMQWANPRARRVCELSLLAGGVSSVIGYAIILIYLERALRAMRPTASSMVPSCVLVANSSHPDRCNCPLGGLAKETACGGLSR